MKNNLIARLSVAELKRATAIKTKIEQLERELTGILGIPEALTIGGMVRRRKKVHAAVRNKVAGAAKSGWNRMRGSKKS